jgi:hypothetical protein
MFFAPNSALQVFHCVGYSSLGSAPEQPESTTPAKTTLKTGKSLLLITPKHLPSHPRWRQPVPAYSSGGILKPGRKSRVGLTIEQIGKSAA